MVGRRVLCPHIVDGEIVHYYILTGEASIKETKEDDLVLDFYTEEIDPNTLCQYTGRTDTRMESSICWEKIHNMQR